MKTIEKLKPVIVTGNNPGKAHEIVTVAGNRPEIIKLSGLVKALDYKNSCLYTGQHYSQAMKDIFFEEFNLHFDYELTCNTSEVDILKYNIVKSLDQLKPKFVIVYGDTNSSLAGALAAKLIKSKLIHIEAGLRSFDLTMREERNRILIDSIADYWLAPTELSMLFLKYENIEKNVFNTGNLIVDICEKFAKIADLQRQPDYPNDYVLLTIHRAETVDDAKLLRRLVAHISQIRCTVLFPMHPRTRNNLLRFNIKLPSNVIATDPVGYVKFLQMLKNCKTVLTDSGGVQEEAVVLKKPCVTLRNSTERQETLLIGANRLFPLGQKNKKSLADIVEEASQSKITINPYGKDVTTNTLNVINYIMNTDSSSGT